MAKALIGFQRDFKGKTRPGYVVHPGSMVLPLGDGVTSLPVGEL
jgi:hypothetical protein